jgi:hypothetical protein|tara:strand:- start:867 stop:1352 length:486 start_codon:yes stop_codon:yes gene_type:complete
MTPGQAHDLGLTPRALTKQEIQGLTVLGNALVPGAGDAGLGLYIDAQLVAPAGDSMLMVRYLGVNPPFDDFYRKALASLDAWSIQKFAKSLAELYPESAAQLVRALMKGEIEDWSGPPQGFFFFVIRNDACDVKYGTKEGFDHLGVPYMAHIEPPTPWGNP